MLLRLSNSNVQLFQFSEVIIMASSNSCCLKFTSTKFERKLAQTTIEADQLLSRQYSAEYR